MRICSRVSLPFVLVWCFYSKFIVGARVKSCDDGWAQSSACDLVLPDPDAIEYCRPPEILALRRGCFRCVNPDTCKDPRTTHPYSAYGAGNRGSPIVSASAPIPSGAVDRTTGIKIQPERSEHPSEQGLLIFHQRPVNSLSVSASSPDLKRLEVSSWLFLIPACLALVSIGTAIRNHYARVYEHLDRIEFENQDEEINPFCSDPRCSPHADDVDLEFGDQFDQDFNHETCRDHSAN